MAKKGRPKKGEEKVKGTGEDQAEGSGGNKDGVSEIVVIDKGKAPQLVTQLQSQGNATHTTPSTVSGSGSKKLWSNEVEKEQSQGSNPNPIGEEPKFTNWAALFKNNREMENGWKL